MSLSTDSQLPSLNLRYYASSFQDKQKEAKQKEKELRNAAAERELTKIKQDSWTVFAQERKTFYKTSGKSKDESKNENYFVDVLNLDYLLLLRGIQSTYFKPFRLLFTCNKISNTSKKEISTKSGTFGGMLWIIQSVIFAVRNLRENCFSFLYRFVGLYYCVRLKKKVQRLIVSMSDISVINNVKKENLPIVYFLKSQSPYHVVFLISVLYWNGVTLPAIFYNEGVKPWMLWISKKLGITMIHFNELRNEGFDIEENLLKLHTESILNSKKDLLFCLRPDIDQFETDANLFCMVIRKVLSNSVVPDAKLITINFSSERIIEESSERALLLRDNKMSSMTNIFESNSNPKCDVGLVRVKFSHPLSLKYIISLTQPKSTENKVNITPFTDRILSQIAYDFSKTEVIMSTNLVSFLLLQKYREGVKLETLITNVDEFRQELISNKKPLGFLGSSQSIVNHSIKLLDSKLEITNINGESFIKPILQLPGVLELFQLSKLTLNHLKLDAVMMNCVSVLFKSKLEDVFKCNEEELTFYYLEFVDLIEKLCEILQTEFVFETSNNSIEEEIHQVFFKYVECEYFQKKEKLYTEEERWGHRYAKFLESDDEDDYYDSGSNKRCGDMYWVNFNADPLLYQKIELYKTSLQPIIDAYVVCAENLYKLINRPILYTELVKELFFQLQSDYNDGKLEYIESVSLNLVQNSIKLFEKWVILESYTMNELKVIYLTDDYCKEEFFFSVVRKIKNFQ